MKRKNILRVILIFIFLIIVFGLWRIMPEVQDSQNSELPTVTTSIYHLNFFVSEVGGDRIVVKNITPPGVEPHDYEPTARDLVQIQKSKLLFISSEDFEPWGSKIKKDMVGTGVTVIEVSAGLVENNDPHIWLSPELAKKEVEVITDELIKADEGSTQYFLENEKSLIAKLDKLSMDFRQGLSSCKEYKVVTSHAAFGYLTQEYGLTQVAISGLTPDEEPSTKQMIEIAKEAEKDKLKYIFFEKLVSPKLAETIAQEIGAKTLVLDPIEGISDNDRSQGKNYLTIMEENLANLRIALECQ